MNVDQDETMVDDMIEPAGESENWLAEQVRLLTLEEGV